MSLVMAFDLLTFYQHEMRTYFRERFGLSLMRSGTMRINTNPRIIDHGIHADIAGTTVTSNVTLLVQFPLVATTYAVKL